MINLYRTKTGKRKKQRCRYVAVVSLGEKHVVVRANRVYRTHIWAATVACPYALSPIEEKQVSTEISEDIASFYSGASIDFSYHYKGDNHHVDNQ